MNDIPAITRYSAKKKYIESHPYRNNEITPEINIAIDNVVIKEYPLSSFRKIKKQIVTPKIPAKTYAKLIPVGIMTNQ